MRKTEEIVLKKIKSGEVKMKPKWWFATKSKLTRGGWLIGLLAASMGLLAITTFIDTYQPLETVRLGEVGQQLLLEDFPYLWLVLGIISLLLGFMFWRNMGDNYKKSTKRGWLIIVATVAVIVILFRFLDQ